MKAIGMTRAEACTSCGVAGDIHDPLCPAWLLELAGIAGRAERRIAEASADLVTLRHGVEDALRAVTTRETTRDQRRAG